jgi:hypothetical protein
MAGGTQARLARWAPVVARAQSTGVPSRVRTQADARRVMKHFETLAKNMVKTLEEGAVKSAKVIQMEIGHGIDRWADKPTGKLERSFKIRRHPTKSLSGLTIMAAAVISDSVYWKIHEYGGTITPKRSRYLTIPVTPMARKLPARHWPRGTLFKPKGKFVLMSKTGRGGRAQTQFILRDSVRIHGKHYVRLAVERARPKFTNIMNDALKRAQQMSDGL